MRTKLVSRLLGALLIVALLLSVVPGLVSGSTDIAQELLAGSDLAAQEPVGEVHQVTLVTGDVVTVVTGADGQRSLAISPAEPQRLGQHFLTIEQDGDTYILPDGVDLNKLDMQLFNIDYLVDKQYYQEPSLPLLVRYLPSLPAPQVQSLEGKISALGQGTKRHSEVFTISTRLTYSTIFTTYNSLMSQPEIDKIWLDRKVQAQLINSVPLISAPSWWAAGYNGTGTEIAILDSGVDSSHPDLNDLDDNPATIDPKVVMNINFSDDTNFNDLLGHGTHVAGIAAGTGAVPGMWDLFGTDQLTTNTTTEWDSAWSPLGGKIAFASDRDGSWDIFIYDIATRAISKLLALSSNESSPAWSRDGTKIAFGRSSDLAAERGIWVVSANGTGLTRLYGAGGRPTWRLDGSELAFNLTPSDNNTDIWAINVSGNTSTLRRITSNLAVDRRPAWSPDGTRIAFTSNRTASWGIWTVSANGTELNPTRIADSTEWGEPAWSANGAWLSFEAPPPPGSKNSRILAVNMDGSSLFPQMVIITSRYQVADGSWSPDGTQLAYTSWQAGNADIYVATKPPYGIRGVAPGAKLWNVKVLNQWGRGYWSWIINGINFASLGADGVAGTGDEPDIINMSIGGQWKGDGTDPLSQAVNLAVERGVVVVVAAGNDGYDGMFTINTPGVAEKAITVGASAKDDTLAPFSSRGPTFDFRIKPNILAPGVGIISAYPPTLGGPIYKGMSGTSMATPHVAGAAALLLEQRYSGGPLPPEFNPNFFVRNWLMTTAKDLGYNVYEQGSGRLDLARVPWRKVSMGPATLSLGTFTSANTTASANLTFYSDNVSHQVTLSANLTDIFSGLNYSANVSFSSGNFTLPPSGNLTVTLGVNLTALPASIYSGKILATVDGGASRSIHAIFGFAKVWQVTVHKIDASGAPAQGHMLYTIIESPVQGIYGFGYGKTDASGNHTFLAIDGTYHLMSLSEKKDTQITFWTVAENVAISGDMSLTLDERNTRLVDFNPNKAGQQVAGKISQLYFNFASGSFLRWGSSWWYPGSFLTRVSPISRFDAGFNYQYYPAINFNPSDPKLVNTGEWHNLLYSTTNITANTTFMADYANLVHRRTNYNVALDKERAEWQQWSWDDISLKGSGFTYAMNAPQGRWEWLSPSPVRYGQHYARVSPWGQWYFGNYYRSYLPGEYTFSMGRHPLTSGVDVGIWWGAPGNRLNIWGPISRDLHGGEFLNHQTKLSGHIKVTQDSKVVLEKDIWDNFGEKVFFGGTANFTVEIKGWTSLPLSRGSYTRLDFTADPTRDSRPPRLNYWVDGLKLDGVVPAGEIQLRIQAQDDSPLQFVALHYSLDDGGNWTAAGAPTFAGGLYTFNLGQLRETFVTIAVDAKDVNGNHIHRNTNRAFYVGLPGTQVSVNAPSQVMPATNFTATIDINQVTDFDATNYNVSLNSTVLQLVNVTSGLVGTTGNFTVIPVDFWSSNTTAGPGTFTIVQNVSGTPGVSGSGYLAVLHFYVLGSLGNSSNITLSNGMLSNIYAREITAAWIGDLVKVSWIPGDATGDGNINAVDITKVERIIANLDAPTPGADATQDGKIDALDITKVERLIARLDLA